MLKAKMMSTVEFFFSFFYYYGYITASKRIYLLDKQETKNQFIPQDGCILDVPAVMIHYSFLRKVISFKEGGNILPSALKAHSGQRIFEQQIYHFTNISHTIVGKRRFPTYFKGKKY